ncbi:MAG TPA: cytochrome c [Gammaproteobacteria bacterium]|nr:cytochrome c [Gammaproteobacteria bacterium]
MDKLNRLMAVILALAFTVSAQAGDVAAGRVKSGKCAGCHGPAGAGSASAPPLAGRSAAVLEKALKDFRDGRRMSPMMNMVTKGLSDADIADLAAYYAAQKP